MTSSKVDSLSTERRKTSTDRLVSSTRKTVTRKQSDDELLTTELTSSVTKKNETDSTKSTTTDTETTTTTISTRKDSVEKKEASARKLSTSKKSYRRQESVELNLNKTPRKTSTEKQTTSRQPSRPSSEIYSEPLRHQKTPSKRGLNQQTDVEKIVSPYGVGPTDENGLPLMGLRALKKKQPAAPGKYIIDAKFT